MVTSISQIETIYNFIDLMGIQNRNENFRISVDYFYFRKTLQAYNQEALSDNERYSAEEIKCFIQAANTKYEVINDEGFINKFVFPAGIGSIVGGLVSTYVVHKLLCKPLNGLPGIIIIGAITGAVLGYEFHDAIMEYELEQNAFVEQVFECYNSIYPIEEI